MDTKEYISSGILELYVLGQLSPEEMAQVEDMQSKYIEVKREIFEISLSLEKYAQLTSVKAPASIADKLFSNLPPKSQISNEINTDEIKKSVPKWNKISTLFALAAVLGFTLYFTQKMEHSAAIKEYKKALQYCDSITNKEQIQFALLNEINNPNNRIINLTSTQAYAGIAIYLHHNSEDRKNFLQLISMPEIDDNQSYQLWSLKDGVDPIPMDVFASKNEIIPVGYEDGTATYAITIEPKGGSKTPSLDKLIGTMSI